MLHDYIKSIFPYFVLTVPLKMVTDKDTDNDYSHGNEEGQLKFLHVKFLLRVLGLDFIFSAQDYQLTIYLCTYSSS